MAPLDSTVTLPDIDGERPAGDNLEFDPAFAELERLSQGKPEQQYGSTIVPAEDPDWKEVIAAAWALMERTYDLRVMTHLAVARLQREGMAGYADSLALIEQVLRTRWEPVHPQLDPEDDNDPTLRANALLGLAEPVRVMRFLRNVPLARSARAGSVCWRDVAISNGTLELEAGGTKMAEGVIAAAFRESDPAALTTMREALDAAATSSTAIAEVFNQNAGYGTGPDFTELTKLLRDIVRVIDKYRVMPADEPVPDAEVAGIEVGPGAAVAAVGRPMAASIATMGPPTNREDALRLLDLVVEFYQRAEPSSPLPLLIARARRLAEMSFLDILRDMAPDGLNQAVTITGRSSED